MSEADIKDSETEISPERRREFLLWLALFAAVMVSRAPNLILDPRLWLDEATWYLAYARQNGVLESLLFVSTKYASYLNLAANIPATLAANLVPLRYAPAVTTAWSFLVQLTPFVLILFGRSRVWSTHGQRLAVCFLLLFGPPAINGEVWLNSSNSQVFCGIIGLVLLCENTVGISKARRSVYLGLLAFCGLSGPYTVFLAPAWVIKAYLEGTRESKQLASAVVVAFLMQALIHLWVRFNFPFAPDRFVRGHWGVRLTILFFYDGICTVFGFDLGPNIARWIGLYRVVNFQAHNLQFMRLAGWASVVGFSTVLWFLLRRRRSHFDLLLPTGFVLILIAGFFLKPPDSSYRYMVVPGTALLLSLFSVALNRRAGWGRIVSAGLLTFSVGAGMTWYWRDVPRKYSPLGRAPGRPTWSEEVDRWREDRNYRLRIWPYPRSVALRFSLLPKAGPAPPAKYIDVRPFSLITKGEEITRVVPVSGLPTDFRLIIKMRSTQPSDKTMLKLVFEDRHGRRLNTESIVGFRWHQDVWIDRWSYLIDLRKGAVFSDVRRLRVVLDSKAGQPHRVSFDRFSIEPGAIGALEPFLPSRPRFYDVFEFESSGRAVRVGE